MTNYDLPVLIENLRIVDEIIMPNNEDHAHAIVERLREAGFKASYAGGCVRDRLLGVTPGDIDIATSASADQVLKLFPESKSVGRAFGVVLAKAGPSYIEVASFRVDGPYSDGRRPDWVRGGTVEEDARRRDFTINGMYFDPLENRIIDFVGGRGDIQAKVVRAIGDPGKRFSEDFLRMFRAVRFAAGLGFEIEPGTCAAIKRLAPEAGRLASERVREELTRIFTGPAPGRGLMLLFQAGLLDYWLPEAAAMSGVAQSERFHPEGDVLTHTMRVLDALESPGAALAWAALLHDIGKPPTADGKGFHRHHVNGEEMAGEICRRLRFSRSDTKRIAALVREHMRFLDFPDMKPSTRRRFVAVENFEEHLELHRADCMGSNGDLSIYEAVRDYMGREPEISELPPPLVTGKDLIGLGFEPGARFGELLGAVREAQLNGELASREEALDFIRRLEKGG